MGTRSDALMPKVICQWFVCFDAIKACGGTPIRCGCASPARPSTGAAAPPTCAWNWARGRATAPSTWPSPASVAGRTVPAGQLERPVATEREVPRDAPRRPYGPPGCQPPKRLCAATALAVAALARAIATNTQAHVMVDTLSGSAIVQSVTSVVENAALTVPAGGDCPLAGGGWLGQFLPPPPPPTRTAT